MIAYSVSQSKSPIQDVLEIWFEDDIQKWDGARGTGLPRDVEKKDEKKDRNRGTESDTSRTAAAAV